MLGESLPALIAFMTRGELGEEIDRARLRKLNADAARAEHELAVTRGEYAPIDVFERAQSNMCAVIQANMRSIPQRAVIQLIGETNEALWKKRMLAEIDIALTQAGNPENYTKESITNEQYESED
ncbi:hypothetical protein SAMN06265784_102750 [Paraburkholderia susongensis]|uniref:Uncharacterized protein n=2 Tax=Paraburkholderia susongensis TaxID=1515439 RepID=A0A1X7JJP1_9BURK|nr:hypothetical protein SAMN06265784_102750 [Paraburkholderia susongensis]